MLYLPGQWQVAVCTWPKAQQTSLRRVQKSIRASCQGRSCSLSPCRVNQNMDKEWPHELALTCLGHQVTIVRLGEQVTHTWPAAMLQDALWHRCMVVAGLQLAAAGSRLQS